MLVPYGIRISNTTNRFNSVLPSYDDGPMHWLAVVGFYLGTLVIHIMSVHVATPESMRDRLSRWLAIVFSPVTAGLSAIKPLIIMGTEIIREEALSPSPAQRALWAGAVAVQISPEHIQTVQRLGWKRVGRGIPLVGRTQANGAHSPTFFILLETSRFTDDRYNQISLPSISNIPGVVIACLQLLYTLLIQGFGQYAYAIRDQGLSSPYVVVLPYLYMSLINLIANFLEDTYTSITVIPPVPHQAPVAAEDDESRQDGSQDSLHISTISAPPAAFFETESTSEAFYQWFETVYPGVELDDQLMINAIPLFHHITAAITMILILAFLTGLKSSNSVGALFVINISVDVMLHPALNTLYERCMEGLWRKRIINLVRVICWLIHISAFVVSTNRLYHLSCQTCSYSILESKVF